MCSEGEIQRHTSFPRSVGFHNFRSNKLLLHELIKLWKVFIPVSINQSIKETRGDCTNLNLAIAGDCSGESSVKIVSRGKMVRKICDEYF